MKNTKILTILLITIIAISSIAIIGYNQNWFQKSDPQSDPTQKSDPQSDPTQKSDPQSDPTQKSDPQSTPAASISAMKLTLEIYGNANMDDKINEEDLIYIQKILNGTAPTTTFADANCDGLIDTSDINQIKAIINGNAVKLYLLDGNKQNISVSLPANRIIAEYNQNTELVRILGIEHLVVGVDSGVDPVKSLFFPNNANSISSVGGMSTPDYEVVLNLKPTTTLLNLIIAYNWV